MAYITIDQDRFFHNLTTLRLKAGSTDKLAIVLKDNAYGHGLETMARLSAEFGIAKAAVRTVDKARRIESWFDDILVLNDKAIAHLAYRFALNSLEDIARAEPGARVDLKVDTGMHRNGIAESELDAALDAIRKKGLKLVGVMTHFRSADELSSEYMWQKKRFEAVKERVRDAGLEVQFHSHNSAALLRCERFDEDFARVGIAAYGFDMLPLTFARTELKPVMSLWAKRIATRTLRKGERIGYGGDFAAPEAMTVSTYDIGYGDGWRRGDSAQPYVTPRHGAVLGRVSMDMLTLEGSEEEVCIFDDARAAARQFGTICYEVTTALSPFIARIVV